MYFVDKMMNRKWAAAAAGAAEPPAPAPAALTVGCDRATNLTEIFTVS